MENEKHEHDDIMSEGCGCGCGTEDETVELIDDEGNAVKFSHVATIDFENNWYVFFSPVEETEGVTPDEVVIFRLESDAEGKDVFAPIEDDKLLDRVYEEYIRILEEDDEEGCEGGCGSCSCGSEE